MPNSSKSQAENKRIVLISRLTIMISVVTIFYILLIRLLNIEVSSMVYLGFIVSSLITYSLIRLGKTGMAKALGLLLFNITIFIVASSEPIETGIHLHLFAAGAVALTVYDFKDWPKSLFFAMLSMVLIISLQVWDFTFVSPRLFSPGQAVIFYSINATVNGCICIYVFLLFSKLNYQVEMSLRESQALMLEQNEQLVKTNKELDRFVYSVSHDLRAPLSSISGLIQLVEKSNDTMETNQYLGLMKGRIAKLEQFIRDIIDFSRNARSDSRLESVDLKELVRETFESLKFISGAEAMVLQDDTQIQEQVSIDKTRFQIVLFNLISNAIRYRNPHIDTCYIRLNSNLVNERLKFQIEDNGIGIHPAHHAKVFDMFYRASENSKGSGLGLYIVKETVEKLGGTIELHSIPGEGTRFTLDLPVKSG
ncbi:MAG: HAMP domain-containing sensor histidine kinase, partial [Bacteroidota bacterium]